MTYQVLARKWRPKTFREMAGQNHVLKALVNALDHDRLHHAYLFTGTRGVGKTTIARILAKCLNCETGVSSEPCGQCQNCVAISEGRFVDLIEVDAASRTKVEDTRELLDNVQYTPTQGRYKVYLIDEVHMLSASSFNALLKTLEEPPPHVKFLLATTDPQKIPATILSRCLQFSLKNLTPERVVDYLKTILEKEMITFDEGALWLLGRAAEGSMRDALSLTDQAIAFGSGKLGEEDVRQMLGTIDHAAVYRLIRALAAKDGAGLLNLVAELSEAGVDFAGLVSELLVVLHRIAIAQTVPEGLDNSLGDREQIVELAAALSAEDVQFYYQMTLVGRRDLGLAPDLRAGLEMLLLRLLAFKPEGVAAPPTEPLSAAPAGGEAAPSAKKPSAQVPPASTPPDRPPEPPVHASTEPIAASDPMASLAAVAPAQTAAESARPPADDVAPAEPVSAPTPAPTPTAPSPAATIDTRAPALEPEPANQPASPPDREPLRLDELSPASWRERFEEFALPGMLGSVAAHCQIQSQQGNRIDFVIAEANATLLNDRHIERLQERLSDYFGTPLQVSVSEGESNEETPARWKERQLAAQLAAAQQAFSSDPSVQALIDTFDGQLDMDSVTLAEKT